MIALKAILEQKNKVLNPPARIGVVGGGQLGRMLSYEAKRLGYYVAVLDPTPDCPAGQVSDKQIIASFHDKEAIRKLAQCTDVLTYEFEHINADILCELADEGYLIYPSGATLKKIQNKYVQKDLLKSFDLPVPDFTKVESLMDLEAAVNKFGLPLVLKTCFGGYDGKGNYVIKSEDDVERAYRALGAGEVPLMAEEFIDFTCEISIMAARDSYGECSFYPVSENIHKENILRMSKIPASIPEAMIREVQRIAEKVLHALDDIGIFCIEMFAGKDGRVYINEIAPRPHNSGHYTIEACITSQYEQLLRIIAGLPLGSTELVSHVVMVNILGNDLVEGEYSVQGYDKALSIPGVYPHIYGKALTKSLKKIGHVTALGNTLEIAEDRAKRALAEIKIVPKND